MRTACHEQTAGTRVARKPARKPGREAFSAWIRREPGPELIRFPLLLTLFFADHVSPDELSGFVETHRRRHEQRLAFYRTMMEGSSADSPAVQTLRFGIAYEEAFLKWLDGLSFDSPHPKPLATVPGNPVRPGPRRRRAKAKA